MVVSELRGEKIDIIPWNTEPARFIAKALSPARVREVFVDDETKEATVVVPEDQLALAIGKEGLNARLAARLTGWKVDIQSDVEFAQAEAEAAYGGGADEEEFSGRCAAILSNGKRCPNASLPGSRFCGVPAHQELAKREGRRRGGRTSSGSCLPRTGGTTRRSQRGRGRRAVGVVAEEATDGGEASGRGRNRPGRRRSSPRERADQDVRGVRAEGSEGGALPVRRAGPAFSYAETARKAAASTRASGCRASSAQQPRRSTARQAHRASRS